MNSREIFDCDPEKVFEKASQGDAEAQAMMGLLYQTGDGLCINEDEAEKWYSRSAEQKHPGGQYRYGLFLLHKNKAFENGLLESALCSKKRKKVIKEAVELLAEAVSCGNVQAMTILQTGN